MDILYFLQEHASPALEKFFLLVTRLTDVEYLMGVMVVLYWCVRKEYAYRIGFSFITASLVNGIFKMAFRVPRPWDRAYTPAVRRAYPQWDAATGYSFPSGHAMGFTAFFLPVLPMNKKRWPKIMAIGAILLVAVSRVYLRVHTPLDVLSGILLGALVFLAADKFYLHMERTGRYGLALWGIPLAVAGVAYGVVMTALAPLDPSSVSGGDDIIKACGALAGLSAGYFLEQRYIRFSEKAPLFLQLLKAVVGLAGLAAVLYGLKGLLPQSVLWDFLRYLLAFLWTMAGMPWLIRKYLNPKMLKE